MRRRRNAELLMTAAIIISMVSIGKFETPADPSDFCSNLKASILNNSAEELVKTLNEKWIKGLPDPDASPCTHEACKVRLNQLFEECAIPMETKTKMTISYGQDTERPVGELDLRTLQQGSPNVVFKLKFKKRPCVSLDLLLRCLDTPSIDRLYPNEKIMILALTLTRIEDSAIEDWIAVYYQNGQIVDGKIPKPLNTSCIPAKEFLSLKFKGRSILSYFEEWEKPSF